MEIELIGAGNMGGPMAANVLAAGHELLAYDGQTAATETLEASGAVRCDKLATLAYGSEVVLLS